MNGLGLRIILGSYLLLMPFIIGYFIVTNSGIIIDNFKIKSITFKKHSVTVLLIGSLRELLGE